jgi:choline kinase
VDLLAVILAAGAGTRLRPLTDTTPKCLLNITGTPLLGRLLSAIHAAGLRRTVVVTGHLSDHIGAYLTQAIPLMNIDLVSNPAYDRTNNAASLAAARDAIGGDGFVLCDADVIFSQNPIPELLAVPDSCAMAIDTNGPFDEESMRVQLDEQGRVSRISKDIAPGLTAGESIGIQKIGREAAPLLWDVLASLVERDAPSAFYEDAFQQMIERGIAFGVSRVASGTWMEIDDATDLAAAQRSFGS